MSFGVNDITGALSGFPNIRVWGSNGRLKIIGGGTPPPTPVVWGSITGIVTNQTDLINYLGLNYYPLSSNPAGYLTQTAADLLYYPLSSNPAGYITAAALAGYVPTTRTLTINGTSYDLSADRSWTIPAGGTVTSVELAAGTGISLSGTNPITVSGIITVTNSAPDQVVALTGGTGISTSGTYPNFTITNTLPDQTVILTAGTGIGVTGTYPSFTISNSSPASGVTLTSAGGTETLVNDGTGPTLATKGLSASTGISLSSTGTAVTITNSAPDQTVVLTPGTGIGITGTYPSFTIDNTAPGTTYTVDNGLTENPTGNFQLGGALIQDTAIDGAGSHQLNFQNLSSSTNTAKDLVSFETSSGGNTSLIEIDSANVRARLKQLDDATGLSSELELTGAEFRAKTPNYTSATIGDVLTLLDNTTGAAEWQTPTTTTGDSLSPLLLMGG